MSLCLTPYELEEITHKRRPSAQIKELAKNGFNFRVRADGTPLVLREWLADRAQTRKPKKTEPNFGNSNAAST